MKPMTHIALFVRSLSGGGAERTALELARALLARGHRVDVLLLSPRVDYFQDIPPGARLFIVGGRPKAPVNDEVRRVYDSAIWLNRPASAAEFARFVMQNLTPPKPMRSLPMRLVVLWDALRLASYCASEKPAIIFANGLRPEASSFAISTLSNSNIPIVPIVHHMFWSRGPLWADWRRRTFPKAPHIVAVSRGVAQSIATEAGIADDAITVIHNPFRLDEIARRGEETPDHPWFSDGGPPVVLGAGWLVPGKDFPTLIAAFERVAAKRPCRLIILGEGRERRALETLIRDRCLDELVSLPGWKANPFAYMSRAALFVLSSRHEGFGRVLVEALACGCPAVSTDCPAGPAEILADPSLLAPLGDADALAATMTRVLDNPPPRSTLLAKAAVFSTERAAADYEKVLARVLKPGNEAALGQALPATSTTSPVARDLQDSDIAR